MHHSPILLAVATLCLVSAACEAEPQEFGGNPGVRRVDRFEAPEEDRNLTAAERATRSQLKEELTRVHGQRPRTYDGLLNGDVEAEQCFADKIAEVTAYVNGRLAARGFNERVDEYEVAANFITEGGYFVLDGNKTTKIHGYDHLGVDTLVSNYRALRPFLHEDVRGMVEAGQSTSQNTNEKGEQTFTLENMNIEEGMYANAGMYAYEKANVADDMAKPALLRRWCTRKGKTPNPAITAIDLSSLPQWQQFFWTTLYFNSGTGRGREFLCQHWLPWAGQSYTGAPNNRVAKYNAAWRTSTYRFMIGTTGPSISRYCAQKSGAACVCDECALLRDCQECGGVDGCGWCENTYQCTSSAEGCGQHETDPAMCYVSTEPTYSAFRPCEDAISCDDCFNAGEGDCGWCASTNTCTQGGPVGPGAGSCDTWSFEDCPADPCTQDWCSTCLSEPGCGFCETYGVCGPGSAIGPSFGNCPDWTFNTGEGSCEGSHPPPPSDGGVPMPDTGAPECTSAPAGTPCDSSASATCCPGLECSAATSVMDERCCIAQLESCSTNSECCGEMQCVGGACECRSSGQSCIKARECCGSSICVGGACS